MCRGERLTGRGARARVLAMLAGFTSTARSPRDEAQALLTAAGLPGFDPLLPDDARLLDTLQLETPAG